MTSRLYRTNVGIVLTNAKGEIFAGERLNGPKDAWQMPQGGIDKNEEPLAAAFRELEEETGIAHAHVELISETRGWLKYDLPEDIAKKIWGGKYRGQKQKWFLFKFSGPDSLVNIEVKNAEFGKWKWLSPDLLIEKIVPFKKEVYRSVFAELLDFQTHQKD